VADPMLTVTAGGKLPPGRPMTRSLGVSCSGVCPLGRPAVLGDWTAARHADLMPGSDLDLVSRRLSTVLGLLEIALPVGAALSVDPGAVEGRAWFWLPQAGAGVLTISEGPAGILTADALLTMERSLENVEVEVLSVENSEDVRFVTRRIGSRAVTTGRGGLSHPADDRATQRARYRFFERQGSAVRIGYRIEEAAAADWQEPLDRVVDSARLL
jgi:hypothetical protein